MRYLVSRGKTVTSHQPAKRADRAQKTPAEAGAERSIRWNEKPRSYGMITESMTWMTPLEVSMSVCTTFAPSIMTVSPSTLMSTVEP